VVRRFGGGGGGGGGGGEVLGRILVIVWGERGLGRGERSGERKGE